MSTQLAKILSPSDYVKLGICHYLDIPSLESMTMMMDVAYSMGWDQKLTTHHADY